MIALIGGLRGIVAAVAGAALMFAVLAAYDRAIDDPAVAHDARKGFVVLAESTALKAQLNEQKRQREAVDEAYARLIARRTMADGLAQNRIEQLEQEISAHEKKRVDAGRLCALDDADIEFLRKP